MSCDQSEADSEPPDGKYAAFEDTRWMKHGFAGYGRFDGAHTRVLVEQARHPDVAPYLKIHPVATENEVTLSMGVSEPPPSQSSKPDVGVMGTFTADQVFALADALEEVAGAARDGELAESLTHE
jgi:hypothetical protein